MTNEQPARPEVHNLQEALAKFQDSSRGVVPEQQESEDKLRAPKFQKFIVDTLQDWLPGYMWDEFPPTSQIAYDKDKDVYEVYTADANRTLLGRFKIAVEVKKVR